MRYLALFLMAGCLALPGWGTERVNPRPQQYATYRAHRIMPDILQRLVKRESKALFRGLAKGLAEPAGSINSSKILGETDQITDLLNKQAPFREVVHQMGFVSGLVAVYTNPATACQTPVREGFQFYLNKKLDRCLFVFDGFPAAVDGEVPAHQKRWLTEQLDGVSKVNVNHQRLLVARYGAVGNEQRHLFSEQSAVFGVSSIYFSNMARLTAHLWYYAWISARGNVSKTPYRRTQH